jgi:hypothetical protein
LRFALKFFSNFNKELKMTMLTQTTPALIVVLSGEIHADGRLTDLTLLKLRKAHEAGREFANAGHRYFYIFPDGRRVGQVRICDVMKSAIEKMDQNLRGVHIPESGNDLLTTNERQSFVNQARNKTSARICQYIQ